jgi:5-methyltetrahydropteroyltriglutamate--homocysteine methyltransferase
MTISMLASGGYEPVAEVLFNQINSDAYFMEYDSDRAGGFEPLRYAQVTPEFLD